MEEPEITTKKKAPLNKVQAFCFALGALTQHVSPCQSFSSGPCCNCLHHLSWEISLKIYFIGHTASHNVIAQILWSVSIRVANLPTSICSRSLLKVHYFYCWLFPSGGLFHSPLLFTLLPGKSSSPLSADLFYLIFVLFLFIPFSLFFFPTGEKLGSQDSNHICD